MTAMQLRFPIDKLCQPPERPSGRLPVSRVSADFSGFLCSRPLLILHHYTPFSVPDISLSPFPPLFCFCCFIYTSVPVQPGCLTHGLPFISRSPVRLARDVCLVNSTAIRIHHTLSHTQTQGNIPETCMQMHSYYLRVPGCKKLYFLCPGFGGVEMMIQKKKKKKSACVYTV